MLVIFLAVIAGIVLVIRGMRRSSRSTTITGAALIVLPLLVFVLFYPVTKTWDATATPFP